MTWACGAKIIWYLVVFSKKDSVDTFIGFNEDIRAIRQMQLAEEVFQKVPEGALGIGDRSFLQRLLILSNFKNYQELVIQDDLHRPFLVAVDVGHELL